MCTFLYFINIFNILINNKIKQTVLLFENDQFNFLLIYRNYITSEPCYIYVELLVYFNNTFIAIKSIIFSNYRLNVGCKELQK